MENTLIDSKLELFFEGELNSYNADNIWKDIENTLLGKEFTTLVLNFAKLNYISSAGLRIVLKLKQAYNDVHITEANMDVYDILSMTGFTNIMDVKKAYKRMYVAGAEIVGEGYFSTVYRIDKDTIIKVFNRTSDENQIQRELNLAKKAFVLGIPTAISFDIVKVDNKLGVRFEMLDCDSLKNTYLKNPDKFDELTDKYVGLLKKINTTECDDPSQLRNIKEFYFEKLELIKEFLETEDYNKLYALLQTIPERKTFVHGDCHFKNIMVQKDELLLIDMDTLSVGHPIFELAAIYAPYIAFDEDDPGNCERFLGVSSDFTKKLFNQIIIKYFGREDQSIFDKIKLVSYIHMMWWNRTNEPQNEKRLYGCRERLLKLLKKYDDLKLEI